MTAVALAGPLTEAAAEHMELARAIAELELTGDRAQHRLRIDLENLLHPYGPHGVAFAAASDLIGLARAEQRARGER